MPPGAATHGNRCQTVAGRTHPWRVTRQRRRHFRRGVLAVCDADPEGDAALLRRLAQWCLRYAPLAGVDPPDGLWIDVTGGAHVHGGETRLLRDLIGRL